MSEGQRKSAEDNLDVRRLDDENEKNSLAVFRQLTRRWRYKVENNGGPST